MEVVVVQPVVVEVVVDVVVLVEAVVVGSLRAVPKVVPRS